MLAALLGVRDQARLPEHEHAAATAWTDDPTDPSSVPVLGSTLTSQPSEPSGASLDRTDKYSSFIGLNAKLNTRPP